MIRELITLANDLDQKGLRKEADYLDRLIKRYAKDAPKEHPGREFVLKRINEVSKDSKRPEDRISGGNPSNQEINLFTYKSSEDVEIEDGILFGLVTDNAEKMIFDNVGSGSDSERVEELETLFPGITSSKGHRVKDEEFERVYSIKCEDNCEKLILIYDVMG